MVSSSNITFNGTYFFNKTQKRAFGYGYRNELALAQLKNFLKQYQQKANIRLFYQNDILTLSTTGKANRYAHNAVSLTKEERLAAKDLGALLIEKSTTILNNAKLLWKPDTTYKTALKNIKQPVF